MKYIASCSFGKDSLGAILLALEHGEPLDEAVYCEVMFDKTISGEVPEHRDFIYSKGIPALERMGIKVTVIRGKKTYVEKIGPLVQTDAALDNSFTWVYGPWPWQNQGNQGKES